MSTISLAAKPVVAEIKLDLTKRCEKLKKTGVIPSMSVVLVGDNPASLSYIRNKKKICEEVGAKFSLTQLPSSTSVSDFEKIIHGLNHDPSIHGIIIQLPVSRELQSLDIPNMVLPHKDIDGFHGINTQKIYAGTTDARSLLPCTPKGIITLLRHYGIEVAGKHIVVVGRSLIVGKPMAMLLTNLNATVTLAHSQTPDLKHFTRDADVVVAAIGKAHHFDSSYFDPKRKTVVIDVGMNQLQGKLVGDVNFESAAHSAHAITPVPGGVGPMTVVSLIENLINACENQLKVKP